MAVLRVYGPGFLGERFLAESPLQHGATLVEPEPGATWQGVHISVSLAPWQDWPARIEDAEAFISAADAEIRKLRPRYGAETLILDFPVTRSLGTQTQGHAFPSVLLAALVEHAIDLRISYHAPDFAGASERHPRVFVHPEVCNGKPVIRGTHVLVKNIVTSLADGQTPSQVIEDFPDIASEDILAAVEFIREQAERS
ncbi:MAG: DUF433 domain-containing protein [Planctomycetes bacterium]|nr:DUF433 domain-containing protein [Planctomycetota bacterium]